MRARGFDGPEGAPPDGARQGIPDDDPVLLAMLNAPLDDEPITQAELRAIEEWRADPRGVNNEAITAMIAERASREG
jgi:hypothetical protein